jgi:hypothetical protein
MHVQKIDDHFWLGSKQSPRSCAVTLPLQRAVTKGW